MNKRATTTAEAFWALDPFALIGPSDPYYFNIEAELKGTGYGLAKQLTKRLTPNETGPEFVHLGIVGHRGTGKTTQVRKVMADLAGHGIKPLFADALASLDQTDLSFADVILLMVNVVVNGLNDAALTVPADTVELIRLWFAEELLTETHRKDLEGSIQTEVGAAAGLSFLAKLTAKVTAVLKTDNEYRREIRRRVERDTANLVRQMNRLLDSASALFSGSKIALVVDNLEKIEERRQVDGAILRRADDLRTLRCDLVLFFAPSDQYAPVTVRAGEAFDVLTLPMLPIRQRNDQPDYVDPKTGAAVAALLDKRIDLELVFEDPKRCVQDVTRLSGGRIRDILHLTRLACELAEPDKVAPQHIETAARKLRGERTPLAKADHWQRLAVIHRDKQVANDAGDAHLLMHSLVLNYDGDPWWDVHPFAILDTRFDEKWNSLKKIKT